jgi:hypothetical protein
MKTLTLSVRETRIYDAGLHWDEHRAHVHKRAQACANAENTTVEVATADGIVIEAFYPEQESDM